MVKTDEEEAVGLEVVDLGDEAVHAGRRLHSRHGSMQMEGLHRLAVAFVEGPATVFQELVNAGVRQCGADSAGISIQREGGRRSTSTRDCDGWGVQRIFECIPAEVANRLHGLSRPGQSAALSGG